MSERITKRIDADCMELFPNDAPSIKVHKNETSIACNMPGIIWKLVNKLYEYENLEDKLKAKSIAMGADTIASHIVTSVDDLSPEMLEAAYRKQELKYRITEAYLQIEEIVYDKYPDTKAKCKKAARVLAERFIKNYDDSTPDDQQWHKVISDYIDYDLDE